MAKLYPLMFSPVFKDYPWGGRNLEKLGRDIPDGIVAESWEIAGHNNGVTIVSNGEYAGKPLTALISGLGSDLVGSNYAWALERGKFPLLIKILDANQPLSVQVHPNDTYALENEGNELGKTEMWVVLNAKPGAEVILGVTKGTTLESFREAIAAGRLDSYLHHVPVKTGDHICVPAGSLHAIMGGSLIAEIQQNSDTTYRVYDWNRVDADGQPRSLHVDQALDVINFAQVEPELCPPKPLSKNGGVSRWLLCQNEYFTVERVTLEPKAVFAGICTGDSLEIWGVIDGSAMVNDLLVNAVQFTLLPAALGVFTVRSEDGATLLRVHHHC
ncbi:MAG: class I mannose-6-phosphate isomerase [Anaerolineae bacterium]|nr:class I mannose-6-phosphate isomerase [Anaerolineae bacterium]